METNFATRDDFVDALKSALSEASDIEKLFELWERNVKTVRDLSRYADGRSGDVDLAKTLVAHFKGCARAHATPVQDTTVVEAEHPNGKRPRSIRACSPSASPSEFALKSICASCCGRSPAHAHHIRFAQANGIGLKVSDEFTVPLCATHHSENHRTGSETKWWEAYKIEPLSIAHQLWAGLSSCEGRHRSSGAQRPRFAQRSRRVSLLMQLMRCHIVEARPADHRAIVRLGGFASEPPLMRWTGRAPERSPARSRRSVSTSARTRST